MKWEKRKCDVFQIFDNNRKLQNFPTFCFIKNINNGFTSKIAFKLVKYEIDPDDETIARFNHFKTMFSPENSFKLLFETQDFNLPNGHVYTDAQIKLMLEYQLIYENNFVDHIQF